MKKLLTVLLFAASFVAAQDDNTYTYTFTAPAGSTSCQQYFFNNQQAYTPENCAILNGFVSPDGLYTATFENGQISQRLNINNHDGLPQVVYSTGMVWSGPTTNLMPGVSYTFSMTTSITQVCTAPSFICQTASGQINISGQWSYQWVFAHAPAGCKAGCTKWIRVWTTTSDLVLDGQSTVAILD